MAGTARDLRGAYPPWNPTPGSPLEGHQTPTAAWHLEVVAKDLDIWEQYGLDPRRHSSGGLHYTDLANMRQHLREQVEARPGHDLGGDLRHALAVEGRLPDL